MILRFTTILILMHLICAGYCLCAPSSLVEEYPEYEARINWSVGIVKAVGRAAVPGDIENPDQAREIAREQAVIAARRNLSAAVGLVHVTGSVTVADRMEISDVIRSGVEMLVKDAGIISSRQIYDRSYEVIVQTSIYGKDGLSSTLSDNDVPSADIPSLMIDVQVDGFQPSMCPEIFDMHQHLITSDAPNENVAIQPIIYVYYGKARSKTDHNNLPVLQLKVEKLTPTGGIILNKKDAVRLRTLLKKHGRKRFK